MKRKALSLQWKITLLVCGVVLLALMVTNILVSSHVARGISDNVGHNAMNIARIVAQSHFVSEGLAGEANDNSATYPCRFQPRQDKEGKTLHVAVSHCIYIHDIVL